MSADYIPKAQLDLATWARNFRNHTSADPVAFGLTTTDAAEIATVVNRFDAALKLACAPDTRTKGAVVAKDDTRADMLALLRHYAQTVKRNPGISNEAKITLGLRIDAPLRSILPAPATVPILYVNPDAPLVQRVTFRDISTPTRKARPAGTVGMLLAIATIPLEAYYGSATSPPMHPSPQSAAVHGLVTHQPYRVQFPATARGQIACYFAHWVNRDGTPGPWSTMAQLMIAGERG